jgi:FkbM family methyltransferase
MFRLFFSCLSTFGIQGLIIYLQLKLAGEKKLKVPGIPHPLMLRGTPEDMYTFREIFMMKEYEIQLPDSLDPNIIIDAGANIGMTSVYLANRYPNAKIYSIEPDEGNFDQLTLNAAPYNQIIPIKGALWFREERISLVDKGLGNRSFMIERSTNGTMNGISISYLMKKFNFQKIDLLKIDIEGSEKEVFETDYQEWLPQTGCLIVELHDRMKAGCSRSVFKAISNYDFNLEVKGENLVFFNSKYSPS